MTCHVCGEQVGEPGGPPHTDLELMVDHIRVLHPDQFSEPDRWPDGGLVIHDADPDPQDYR